MRGAIGAGGFVVLVRTWDRLSPARGCCRIPETRPQGGMGPRFRTAREQRRCGWLADAGEEGGQALSQVLRPPAQFV